MPAGPDEPAISSSGRALGGLTAGIALSLVFGISSVRSQVNNEASAQAALAVMAFDHFAAQCRRSGGFSVQDAVNIAVWESSSRADQVRTSVRGAGRTRRQQLDRALSVLTGQIEARGVNACRAAISVAKLPNDQFAAVSPGKLENQSGSGPQAAAAPRRGARSTSSTLQTQNDIVARINSFGFATRMKMGIGGFLTVDIYPVVLFDDGGALTDVKGLGFRGGLAAHKRAKPGDWTRWRREAGVPQLLSARGWQPLPFAKTYSKLPPDFKLDGRFRVLGGVGNVSLGGSDTLASWTEYRFYVDGRVERGGGTGGRTETSSGSTVSSSVSPDQRGRYHVEGLTLVITYGDGSGERRILITDPNDPKSAIWLDGVGYARRRG